MIVSKLTFGDPYRAKIGEHPQLDAIWYDTFYIGRAVIDVFTDITDSYFWRMKVGKNTRHGLTQWKDCEAGYGDAGTMLWDLFEFLGWTPPKSP